MVIGATSLAGDKVAPVMTGVENADAVTKGRLLLPANTVTLLSNSIRTAISAPTKLRRSARMRPVNKAEPGDADLGLGGARDDGAFRVADHDVANAQRCTAVRVAFELRAAELDLMPAAEIFLDRCGQPGGGNVELDRAAGKRHHSAPIASMTDAAERAADKCELAQARPPQDKPRLPIAAPLRGPARRPKLRRQRLRR